MKIKNRDFSYCLNIFAGETWEETFDKIKTKCLLLSKKLSSYSENKKFGLGLRISNIASKTLLEKNHLEELKIFLEKHNLYAFTVNAFPFGQFHNTCVKETVYSPDWSKNSRLEYTKNIAIILQYLLPDYCSEGSISTVPIGYGKQIPKNAVENLLAMEDFLTQLERDTGKKLTLALEPEPDCYLENTEECILFFAKLQEQYKKTLKYLGICFDTCHIALQYEDLQESLGLLYHNKVAIHKIQISSVLSIKIHKEKQSEKLRAFDDGVYLHQTRIKTNAQELLFYKDLPIALEENPNAIGEWRVHCHVPLHFNSNDELQSTSNLLTTDFFNKAFEYCPHFEIETYTFNVLPNYKEKDIIDCISQEFDFCFKKLKLK